MAAEALDWPARPEPRRRWPRACSPTTTPSGRPAPRMSGECSPVSWRGPVAASPTRPSKRKVCCSGWSPRSRTATRATWRHTPSSTQSRRHPGYPECGSSPRPGAAPSRPCTATWLLHSSRSTRPGLGGADRGARRAGMWCDQRWQVAHHAGDHDTITELISTLRNVRDPHWMVYDAIVAADLGDVPEPHGWPRKSRRSANAGPVGGPAMGRAQRPAGHPRARPTSHRRSRRRLERDAGHWAVLGGGVLVHGPVSLWLGRLEAGRGNDERALLWATQAEAAALRLDAHLWLLEARADRLALQHAMGTAVADEVASTLSSALSRGLLPIVERLQLFTRQRPAPPMNVFRRDRDIWTLGYDGIEARLPDSKGLHDLHTLIANPRVDIPATSLATGAFVNVDAAPILDARAKADYRRRLDDLDRQLDRPRSTATPQPKSREGTAGLARRTSPGRRTRRSRPQPQRRPGTAAQDGHSPHAGHPAPARRPPSRARRPPPGLRPHRHDVQVRPGGARELGPRLSHLRATSSGPAVSRCA